MPLYNMRIFFCRPMPGYYPFSSGDVDTTATRRCLSILICLNLSIRNSASPEEIHSNLIDMGFTHLLIRFDMFDNWCNHNLDQKEIQMVIRLLSDRNSLLYTKNGHGLYKL